MYIKQSFYSIDVNNKVPSKFGRILPKFEGIHMSEISEWNDAVEYSAFLKAARENIELMKARYNDLPIIEEDEELIKSIQNTINILVIGTDRCNDTAGNLPVLARIASLSPKVNLRILDSDKHARFHQEFRVNGKRKSPVVLFLSEELFELCRWVERPNAVYRLVNEKSAGIDERRAQLRKLYSDSEIQRQSLGELIELLLRADFVLGRK